MKPEFDLSTKYMTIRLTIILSVFLVFSGLYLRAQNNYKLTVTTKPDHVAVYSNSKFLGLTPLKLRQTIHVPADTVSLHLIKDDAIDTIIGYKEKMERSYHDNHLYPSDIQFNLDLSVNQLADPKIVTPAGFKLSIGNVIVDIRQGTAIGSNYSIKLYYENPEYASSKDFKTIAEQECQNAGLVVLGKLNLFAEDKEESEYVLGGVVNKIFYEVNGEGMSRATIEWQLFDRVKKEIVFKKTIEAHYFEEKAGAFSSLFFGAYRIAVRKLLRDKDFLSKLSELHSSETLTKTPTEIGIPQPPKGPFIDISTSTPLLLSSSVTVKSGINRHGSGFLISQNGYILTNYHVIERAETIEIIMNSGISLNASVISENKESDLALLQVSGKGFVPLLTGNSDSTRIGEEVMAIGTPVSVELGQSVTKGVISAKRTIDGKLFLQADASVSPGNSGGPLINARGEVIGIISSKQIGRGVEGICFAIPINEVFKALNLKFK